MIAQSQDRLAVSCGADRQLRRRVAALAAIRRRSRGSPEAQAIPMAYQSHQACCVSAIEASLAGRDRKGLYHQNHPTRFEPRCRAID